MGRPKGSKNKATLVRQVEAEAVSEIAELPLKAKRTRKPTAPPTALEKLTAAGLTVEDLRALLGQAPDAADAKAALKAEMAKPLSPAEVAKLRAEALANTPKEGHAEAVVARAIEEVIKPNWNQTAQDAAGLKHFLVNASRHGESVSMDKEKWDFALKQAGIRGVLTASKPENGQDLDAKSVGRWRVMIG